MYKLYPPPLLLLPLPLLLLPLTNLLILRLSAHPVVKSFISGSVSGFCSTVLFQPFDLVKTRLQEPTNTLDKQRTQTSKIVFKNDLDNAKSSSSSHQRGSRAETSCKKLKMSSIVLQVVRDDGVLGLWRGVTPSLARTVPGVGLYFGFLHSLKTALNLHQRKMTSKESFFIGATSRVSAAGKEALRTR